MGGAERKLRKWAPRGNGYSAGCLHSGGWFWKRGGQFVGSVAAQRLRPGWLAGRRRRCLWRRPDGRGSKNFIVFSRKSGPETGKTELRLAQTAAQAAAAIEEPGGSA